MAGVLQNMCQTSEKVPVPNGVQIGAIMANFQNDKVLFHRIPKEVLQWIML